MKPIERKCKCCKIVKPHTDFYKDITNPLGFHHKESSKKDFCVGRQTGINKARKEVKKCVLVCSNCHFEIHSGMIVIPL
jgi:hypothetical protein